MDGLSRREVIKGGGLLATAWVLAGCQTSMQREGPDPVTPGSAAAPITPRGPSYTAVSPAPVQTAPSPSPMPAPVIPSGVQPRSQWTKAGVARPNDINPMRGVNRITVHHDGMNAFTNTSAEAAAARLEQIRLAHTRGRGWADIGYHYIIDPGGRVWEGRSVRYQGAHVENNNENNLGVMCMGNFDIQSPSSAQLAALDAFLSAQMRAYGVPVRRVFTHQEINPTACPGKALQRYMVQTRQRGGRLALA